MTGRYKYLRRNEQKRNTPFPAISTGFQLELGQIGPELLSGQSLCQLKRWKG